MNNSSIRGGLATIALIAVAACSSNTGGGYTPTPAAGGMQAIHAAPQSSSHQPPAVQTPSPTQRTLAGAALSVAGSTIDLDQFGSSDSRTVHMLRHGRTISHNASRARSRRPAITASNTPIRRRDSIRCRKSSSTSTIRTARSRTTSTRSTSTTRLRRNRRIDGNDVRSSANQTSFQMYESSFRIANGGLTNIVVQKTNNQGTNLFSSGFTCLFQTGNAVDCGSGIIATAH